MCHHPEYGCEQCATARLEIVEELGEYLKQFRAEAKGVEERIDELKKEG